MRLTTSLSNWELRGLKHHPSCFQVLDIFSIPVPDKTQNMMAFHAFILQESCIWLNHTLLPKKVGFWGNSTPAAIPVALKSVDNAALMNKLWKLLPRIRKCLDNSLEALEHPGEQPAVFSRVLRL